MSENPPVQTPTPRSEAHPAPLTDTSNSASYHPTAPASLRGVKLPPITGRLPAEDPRSPTGSAPAHATTDPVGRALTQSAPGTQSPAASTGPPRPNQSHSAAGSPHRHHHLPVRSPGLPPPFSPSSYPGRYPRGAPLSSPTAHRGSDYRPIPAGAFVQSPPVPFPHPSGYPSHGPAHDVIPFPRMYPQHPPTSPHGLQPPYPLGHPAPQLLSNMTHQPNLSVVPGNLTDHWTEAEVDSILNYIKNNFQVWQQSKALSYRKCREQLPNRTEKQIKNKVEKLISKYHKLCTWRAETSDPQATKRNWSWYTKLDAVFHSLDTTGKTKGTGGPPARRHTVSTTRPTLPDRHASPSVTAASSSLLALAGSWGGDSGEGDEPNRPRTEHPASTSGPANHSSAFAFPRLPDDAPMSPRVPRGALQMAPPHMRQHLEPHRPRSHSASIVVGNHNEPHAPPPRYPPNYDRGPPPAGGMVSHLPPPTSPRRYPPSGYHQAPPPGYRPGPNLPPGHHHHPHFHPEDPEAAQYRRRRMSMPLHADPQGRVNPGAPAAPHSHRVSFAGEDSEYRPPTSPHTPGRYHAGYPPGHFVQRMRVPTGHHHRHRTSIYEPTTPGQAPAWPDSMSPAHPPPSSASSSDEPAKRRKSFHGQTRPTIAASERGGLVVRGEHGGQPMVSSASLPIHESRSTASPRLHATRSANDVPLVVRPSPRTPRIHELLAAADATLHEKRKRVISRTAEDLQVLSADMQHATNPVVEYECDAVPRESAVLHRRIAGRRRAATVSEGGNPAAPRSRSQETEGTPREPFARVPSTDTVSTSSPLGSSSITSSPSSSQPLSPHALNTASSTLSSASAPGQPTEAEPRPAARRPLHHRRHTDAADLAKVLPGPHCSHTAPFFATIVDTVQQLLDLKNQEIQLHQDLRSVLVQFQSHQLDDEGSGCCTEFAGYPRHGEVDSSLSNHRHHSMAAYRTSPPRRATSGGPAFSPVSQAAGDDDELGTAGKDTDSAMDIEAPEAVQFALALVQRGTASPVTAPTPHSSSDPAVALVAAAVAEHGVLPRREQLTGKELLPHHHRPSSPASTPPATVAVAIGNATASSSSSQEVSVVDH